MTTKKDLDQEIERKRAEIEQLEAQKDRINSLTREQAFAEDLHDRYCHKNHPNMCSWYSKGKWCDQEREKYLETAKKILEITDEDSAKVIIDATRFL